jgi:hypothetical protein
MKYFIFKPGENLCDVEIGQEFRLKNDGRWYVLLQRNIIHCVVGRETWWDIVRRFFKGEKKNVNRYKGNGNSTPNGPTST